MKKLDNKLQLTIGIIIGLLITATTVYANNLSFTAKEISYDNTTSGISKTSVQDAIDELCEDSKKCKKIKDNNIYFEYGDPTTSSTTDYTTLGKNLFVALNGDQKSICIIRNNKLHCFDINNYQIEKVHILDVYSDITCSTMSSYIYCSDGRVNCRVNNDGSVMCVASSGGCDITKDGVVECTSY